MFIQAIFSSRGTVRSYSSGVLRTPPSKLGGGAPGRRSILHDGRRGLRATDRMRVAAAVATLLFAGAAGAAEYNEAPMLQERVAAGNLPPVEERLPEEPEVLTCLERIGVYGGEMQTMTPVAGFMVEEMYMNWEPLLRFAPDGVTILPNAAASWELAKDARSILITLRKGMKWSDGFPVTTEDVDFAWHEVILNKDITPLLSPSYIVGGEPMTLEILDEIHFRFSFKEPYGSVLFALLHSVTEATLLQPKHYLKKFHIKYVPEEELVALAKKKGFDHWFELFRDENHTVLRLSGRVPPDYPTISPWMVLDEPTMGHVILERNPYYWKVDTEGNQLPYIDGIHSELVGNKEARNMKSIAGEIDFASNPLENAPLLLSNQERGKYSVRMWVENQGTRVTYFLNQTYPDEEMRNLFRDRRFRIALSLGINREEINDILYFGKCIPRQATVNRACSYFEPEFETSYAEFDPDRANRILDEIGLVRKGAGGWRYFPSGRQIVLSPVVIEGGFRPEMTELVADYWADLGILLSWRVVDNELVYTKLMGNQLDLAIYPGDTATDVGIAMGTPLQMRCWGGAWEDWLRSDGAKGEEPPDDIKELWSTWQALKQTGDDEERIRLGKKIVRSQAENLYGIGAVGGTIGPMLVTDRLHNVPGDGALLGWPWGVTTPHQPAQWFIEE
jgi:peptide/nickel transport system substrate-binding protein